MPCLIVPVGEHDSSNQEEKPTGLSPDQTSPSAGVHVSHIKILL